MSAQRLMPQTLVKKKGVIALWSGVYEPVPPMKS